MKNPFLVVCITLAFLGLSISVPAFAGKDKNCDPNQGEVHPSCGGGGGGDDHGDPPAQFCAELYLGGFDFGKRTVTRNNRGNGYNSPVGLVMDRPPEGDDRNGWDRVFETCPVLDAVTYPITSLTVSDLWSIDNGGARSTNTPGSPVLVSFRNAYPYPHPEIEVDLHLVGTLPSTFPTESSEPDNVEIELYEFWFYVHAHGNESCTIVDQFDPAPPSWLRMTWGPCPTGP